MCTKKEFQKRSLISNKCVGRSIHHWECCAKNANWHQCSVTTNFKAIREALKNHMTFFTTKKAFHHPNFFSILKRHFLCENFSTFRFRFSRKHNHYVNLVIYMIWKILVVRKKNDRPWVSTFSDTFSCTISLFSSASTVHSHIYHIDPPVRFSFIIPLFLVFNVIQHEKFWIVQILSKKKFVRIAVHLNLLIYIV